ncbi:uncharacterized protein PSFLO_04335 [Pseudozyma flocculosa]|uniref:Zn(2)-C6 fungal-type domain-containing protein n=1 Tax=Pseudozyma flocculosa TaxID=84751 RepID=A0A5C3F4H6_9BASI|nr:uncharacterized protein PSFLO_04335 [Pseudozyma flocculosa]
MDRHFDDHGDGDGHDASIAASSGPRRTRHSTRSSISCLACRESKVRCFQLPGGTGTACSRCARRQLECIVPATTRRNRRSTPSVAAQPQHSASSRILGPSDAPIVPGGRDRLLPSIPGLASSSPKPASTSTQSVPTPPSSRGTHTPLGDPLRLLADASQGRHAQQHGPAPALRNGQRDRRSDDDADDDEDETSQEAGPSRHSSSTAESMNAALRRASNWRERNRRSGYSTYFRHRMFAAKPDSTRSISPVSLGLVDEQQADELLGTFMKTFNRSCHLLDPALHTLGEIRKHALLSSTIFLLSARASRPRSTMEPLALRLEQHINNSVIPHVLLEDCRSLEIVQAFILLATYHPPTRVAKTDRAWSYLGHAVRIATSLDHELYAESAHPTVGLSSHHGIGGNGRAARNLQRTWLHLCGLEQLMASYLGRHAILRQITLLRMRPRWYDEAGRLPNDVVVFMMCELSVRLAKAVDLLDTIQASLPSSRADVGQDIARHGAEPLMSVYQSTIKGDLDAWHSQCVEKAKAVEDSGADRAEIAAGLQLLELYRHYAFIYLTALKIQMYDVEDFFAAAHVADFYLHAVAFANVLGESNSRTLPTMRIDGHDVDAITFSGNSLFVCGAYVGVIALMLLQRAADRVDRATIVHAVETIIDRFRGAGSVTPHRNGCALAYSHFLKHQLRQTVHAEAAPLLDPLDTDGFALSDFAHGLDDGLLMLLNAGNGSGPDFPNDGFDDTSWLA